MTAHATVFSQPGCQPCAWMKRQLDRFGVPWTERDVQADEQALAELHEFFEALAPGRQPQTPVVVIDDADGHGSREILFGMAADDLKALVRDGRIVTEEAA